MPTAPIAGALGVVGRALVEHLEDDPSWTVIGLSRRAPDFETSARFVQVDLLDGANAEAKLGGLSEVTHVFFTPCAPRATFAEEVAPNLAMLIGLVEILKETAPGLAQSRPPRAAQEKSVAARPPRRPIRYRPGLALRRGEVV